MHHYCLPIQESPYRRSLILNTQKSVVGLNCIIPFILNILYGIIQFGPKMGVASVRQSNNKSLHPCSPHTYYWLDWDKQHTYLVALLIFVSCWIKCTLARVKSQWKFELFPFNQNNNYNILNEKKMTSVRRKTLHVCKKWTKFKVKVEIYFFINFYPCKDF